VTQDHVRPRIAVIAGPSATILNSAPLITSNKARRRLGLPLLCDDSGRVHRFDQLRLQRLAQPVTVYVEQFSAHPLEADAAELYGPPDGYLSVTGEFRPEPVEPTDRPVYRIELQPEDGLYPLPYMAVQADGSAWEGDATSTGESRQPFFPDGSRLFEEIDRLGWGENGESNLLGSVADYDFYRVAPSGGYTNGLPAEQRTDVGKGDIIPEQRGEDYFPYRPRTLRSYPARRHLADITNRVTEILCSGSYDGALWLEGSPSIEETIYWLNLLIDTELPLVACASTEYPHGCLGASGDRNLVHAVRYLSSGIWADAAGSDRLGFVLLDAGRIFTARDVQKLDARPGGYGSTGGHGGIVATIGDPGVPVVTNIPVWRHTGGSEVRLSRIPVQVDGTVERNGHPVRIPVMVRDADGGLRGDAIPHVVVVKHVRYGISGDFDDDVAEIMTRIGLNLRNHPLAGFVVEATAPYGATASVEDHALRIAALSGMPVVRVGRGGTEGWVPQARMRLAVAGANLSATKARILLMACLLRFGAWPAALDPEHPTSEEVAAIETAAARYQEVFDSH